MTFYVLQFLEISSIILFIFLLHFNSKCKSKRLYRVIQLISYAGVIIGLLSFSTRIINPPPECLFDCDIHSQIRMFGNAIFKHIVGYILVVSLFKYNKAKLYGQATN